METLETLKPLVLVVDDQASAAQDVEEALGKSEYFSVKHLPNPSGLESIHNAAQVLACILDIRFDEGRSYIHELLDRASQKWPTASLVILSNYVKEVTAAESKRAAVVSKLRFGQDRFTLLAGLEEQLRERKSMGVAEPFLQHLTDRLAEREEEIFSFEGYVTEICEPYVEVAIREPSKKVSSFVETFGSIFSRLIDNSREPSFRRLRMKYDLFRAVALGQDMPFKYRVFRQRNRVIAEVIPVDASLEETLTLEERVELDDLVKREEEEWKKQGKSR